MSIPPEVLAELKKPLGKLILDSDITEKKIKKEIAGIKHKIITVGDRSTERLVSFGIYPDLAIIDGIERRQEKEKILDNRMSELKAKNFTKISCINPAGTITKEAINKIRFALTGEKDVLLHVIGEEDLLTLPACYFAPNDSLVCYGQPLEGLVLIKVNDSIKRKAKELMKSINNKLLTGYDDVVAV
ncbi:MAG TPA: GTP-dependent dephospho-CoA kinase family protein [Nitrososphaeraceae archaeon]|nr:GTP-dependent dephospho-CoA kinase family protein [Nitrososphaeraceae archaeon]